MRNFLNVTFPVFEKALHRPVTSNSSFSIVAATPRAVDDVARESCKKASTQHYGVLIVQTYLIGLKPDAYDMSSTPPPKAMKSQSIA